MDLEKRISAFLILGERIKNIPEEQLNNWINQASSRNNWFTEFNIKASLKGILKLLGEKDLKKWISHYHISDKNSKNVGVVMAGNIPLVGFHDFLCVLISGHTIFAKLSGDDDFLLKEVADILVEIEPAFKEKINFVERIKDIDAVIATGSDNTAKYFHYYFSKIPHIIRQNKTSCAVLTGEEDEKDLENLGLDIFLYFGMGCRNVSKIFVPTDYNFDKFFRSMEKYRSLVDLNKYYNNYDYNKSVYLINNIPHLDNGFLLLKESKEIVSPLSVLFYEYYASKNDLVKKLDNHKDKIQVIVGKKESIAGIEDFGNAQCPSVEDYADGVDTMKFLEGL